MSPARCRRASPLIRRTGVLVGMPNAGTGGTYHLTITASNGFGATASQSFTLTVYQQPTVNVPAGASLNESTAMVFSSGNGNAISVADPNAASADRLTLTATHGTIKLGATAGLHVVSGTNKSASLTVSGTLANLNAALNGLIFTPATGYVGNASLDRDARQPDDRPFQFGRPRPYRQRGEPVAPELGRWQFGAGRRSRGLFQQFQRLGRCAGRPRRTLHIGCPPNAFRSLSVRVHSIFLRETRVLDDRAGLVVPIKWIDRTFPDSAPLGSKPRPCV